MLFERGRFLALGPITGRPLWQIGPVRGVTGVPGTTSRDLFLVGRCPITSTD